MNGISRWQQFSWQDGNRFLLLVDGSEIYIAMLDAIQSARSQILLEMYLVSSGVIADRFIRALIDAKKRHVDVYILFDDYGARGLGKFDRERLDEAGIHSVYYNPVNYGKLRRSLLRDHRKLLIVDGRVAFIGGMGITDDFDNVRKPQRYWHDVAVQVEGLVVKDWLAVFKNNWEVWTRNKYPIDIDEFIQLEIDPGQVGRVAAGRFFGRSEIQRSFVKRVLGAEHHVWMMTAYFVPMRRMLRAMRIAAKRGVDVRILVPGPETDHPAVRYAGRRHFHALLESGVRIFEYQPRFLHGKILLCDSWVSLGSSNVDSWNMRWNLEANQEIEDTDFTLRVRELFEADFEQSTECLLKDWPKRSWHHQLLEWFWGKIEKVVEKISEQIQRKKNH
ncbi:phospholipase D-like domain-containing protein [Kaarinaea lacus]